MRLVTVSSLVLATITTVANAITFLQCADPAIQAGLLSTVVNSVTTLLSPANSYTGCPMACGSQHHKYSLYQPGLVAGVLGTCYCVDTDPVAYYITKGSNSLGDCPPTTYRVSYIENPTYAFYRCQTGGSLGGGVISLGSTYAECFAFCNNHNSAYMIIKALSKELLHCTCGASMSVPGTPATCDTGTQELYLSSLVSPPTVSSYRRRSRIAEEIKAQANSHVFCPPGLSACSIANSTDPDAYECLNTNIELDSCGGCVNGHHHLLGHLNVPAGENCALMAGAALHSTMCLDGVCVASQCRHGYTLIDGRCLAAEL